MKKMFLKLHKIPPKQLCLSLFVNKSASLGLEPLAQLFSCEFCEIS